MRTNDHESNEEFSRCSSCLHLFFDLSSSRFLKEKKSLRLQLTNLITFLVRHHRNPIAAHLFCISGINHPTFLFTRDP